MLSCELWFEFTWMNELSTELMSKLNAPYFVPEKNLGHLNYCSNLTNVKLVLVFHSFWFVIRKKLIRNKVLCNHNRNLNIFVIEIHVCNMHFALAFSCIYFYAFTFSHDWLKHLHVHVHKTYI